MHLDYRSDYHTHTRYSDGSGTVAEMAAAASAAGLTRIVITDHSPLPFATRYALKLSELENYRADIREARATWGERLEIGMGMEFEFIPEQADWLEGLLQHTWDHRIVSIHHLGTGDGRYLVNGNASEFSPLLAGFKGDGKALCRHYYQTLQEGLDTGWFDSVGHLDIIKKHNPTHVFFDESDDWYRDLVHKTLDLVKTRGMSLEINTGGFFHPPAEQYPSTWILRAAAERAIPLVLSSDAHAPSIVARHFEAFRPPA